LRADEVFYKHLFHLLAFIRCPMLNMCCQDMEKLRHEFDPVKELSRSV
jgi:hypothetical protein